MDMDTTITGTENLIPENHLEIQDLSAALLKLRRLKSEVDKSEQIVKTLKSEYDALNYQIASFFETEGIRKISREEGDYNLAISTRYRLPKADRQRGHEWLRKIGEDHLIKTEESVHHGSLEALCRRLKESGHEIPDFISCYEVKKNIRIINDHSHTSYPESYRATAKRICPRRTAVLSGSDRRKKRQHILGKTYVFCN